MWPRTARRARPAKLSFSTRLAVQPERACQRQVKSARYRESRATRSHARRNCSIYPPNCSAFRHSPRHTICLFSPDFGASATAATAATRKQAGRHLPHRTAPYVKISFRSAGCIGRAPTRNHGPARFSCRSGDTRASSCRRAWRRAPSLRQGGSTTLYSLPNLGSKPLVATPAESRLPGARFIAKHPFGAGRCS